MSDQPNSDSPLEHPPTGAAAQRSHPELSRELALLTARTAAEQGGTDILVLDMTAHTAVFDYFVIVTGTSLRQLKAMCLEIERTIEEQLNDKRSNIDGDDNSRWIVLDFGTVVVHLFDEDTRKFYSLESLWADAEEVDLTETLQGIRQR